MSGFGVNMMDVYGVFRDAGDRKRAAKWLKSPEGQSWAQQNGLPGQLGNFRAMQEVLNMAATGANTAAVRGSEGRAAESAGTFRQRTGGNYISPQDYNTYEAQESFSPRMDLLGAQTRQSNAAAEYTTAGAGQVRQSTKEAMDTAPTRARALKLGNQAASLSNRGAEKNLAATEEYVTKRGMYPQTEGAQFKERELGVQEQQGKTMRELGALNAAANFATAQYGKSPNDFMQSIGPFMGLKYDVKETPNADAAKLEALKKLVNGEGKPGLGNANLPPSIAPYREMLPQGFENRQVGANWSQVAANEHMQAARRAVQQFRDAGLQYDPFNMAPIPRAEIASPVYARGGRGVDIDNPTVRRPSTLAEQGQDMTKGQAFIQTIIDSAGKIQQMQEQGLVIPPELQMINTNNIAQLLAEFMKERR